MRRSDKLMLASFICPSSLFVALQARTMIRHDLEAGDAMEFDEELRTAWTRGVPPSMALAPAAPVSDLPEVRRYIVKVCRGAMGAPA